MVKMLVDDYIASDDHKQDLIARRAKQDQLIELYRERYEQGLAIFTGEPLPPGENPELGDDGE